MKNDLYKELKPNEKLSKYIDCVWKESYTNNPANRNKSFLVVPDNTVELVFTANKVKRNLQHRNLQTHSVRSHLSGLKTIPQQLYFEGDVLLSIRFKPYGLYPFAHIDWKETIDASLQPEDIFGPGIHDLKEQLFCNQNDTTQLNLIESFFTRRLHKLNEEKDLVFDHFIEQILLYKGNLNLEEVAQKCNVSKKTIDRKFLSKLGVTPKKYCRIVRIFNALKVPSKRNRSQTLTTIAFDNGFYDQAHFIKEVKHFTGMAPGDYFKSDRSIQSHIFGK